MFVLVFLLVLILTVVITFTRPEAFASTARIRVEQDRTEIPQGIADVPGIGISDPNFIQTTVEIMQSPLVLSNVVTSLDLKTRWGKKYFNGETLKTMEALEILKQRIRLAPVRNSELIAITVYSEEAREAADIANAIARAYMDYRFESLRFKMTNSLAAMQNAYQRQDWEINQVRAELDQASADVKADKASLREKQWTLDQMLESHKRWFAKIDAAKLDLEIPRFVVQLTDTAEVHPVPVKPNKKMDIILGMILAAFLGTLAGGATVLAAHKWRDQ